MGWKPMPHLFAIHPLEGMEGRLAKPGKKLKKSLKKA
jgi:hypothetical protein